MLRLRTLFALLTILFFVMSCAGEKNAQAGEEPYQLISEEDNSEEQQPPLSEQQIAAIRLREQAALIAAAMTDSELACQCLLAALDNRTGLSESQKSLLRETPAGSVMLFRYNLNGSKDEVRAFLNELSLFITDTCGIPPFVAVDHEGGLVHRFGPDVMKLPAPLSFWEMALEQGESMALANMRNRTLLSGFELRGLGITMNLAPVAEVLNAENQAFLETRSFGPEPGFVERAASSFIDVMDIAGIASVVKHFPGNSADDPHFGSSIIKGSKAELDVMVSPFIGIIQHVYPAAVMVSHSIVPAIDPDNNASLSHNVVSDWLKGEMGFSGIVIADDFTMRAVSANNISAQEAAVRALNAGVDMIMCWPYNMVSIHKAIVRAVEDGRLERTRLLDAAERVLAQKLRYGLVPAAQAEDSGIPAVTHE